MKILDRSHLLIALSLVLVAGGVWFARSVTLNASTDVLKPQMVSHYQNVIDPRTGQESGEGAFDFATANDKSTFSIVYINDDGASSEVLFYDFDDPPNSETAFRFGINYSFVQNQGDDGFLIQYSTSGSTSCSDAASRSWVTIDEIHSGGERKTKEYIIKNASASQICVRVDSIVNNDLDSAGYNFRDSNGLKIYDIWLEVAKADVEMKVSVPAERIAVDQLFQYTVTAANLGASPAEDVAATFKLPREVDFVEAAPTHGEYNVGLGTWDIGELGADEEATLLVMGRLADGRVGDVIYASTGVSYYDPVRNEKYGHGNSKTFEVSDVPAQITIVDLPEVEPEEADIEEVVEEEPDEAPPLDFEPGIELEEEDFEEQVEAPEEVVVSPAECILDCSRTGFYLYIVNPDGTTRDTLSDFARITALGERHFKVSFEDKGADFDYNDIAFELNVSDCRNAVVTMTDLNAGWHHQVRANITFDGLFQDSIVLWEDSHTGKGETLSFDLYDYISPSYLSCE